AATIAAMQPASAEELVRVGMIPGSGATTASADDQKMLQTYLSDALGAAVKLVVPKDYNATLEGLGNGSFEFAILGAVGYVRAHEKFGVVPLVQRDIDKQFHSLFITQANSSINSLGDLKGKRFAFGDFVSTSGHVMPYRSMVEAGIDPTRDLRWSRFAGSHAATVKAVAAGVADAGSVDETVFRSLVADGKVDGSKLRVFYTTPPFVDYVWVARKEVDGAMQKKFAEAFLHLTPGRDDKVLGILRGKRFAVVTDAEYQPVQDYAKKLSLF
ncbi:MAG: phosphate/phosphite/phosphonate ABC transporter substrate-binding protein, partial [Bradyrhizobium sp.]